MQRAVTDAGEELGEYMYNDDQRVVVSFLYTEKRREKDLKKKHWKE